MKNTITTIKIDDLHPHQANPNRMSRANFKKLIRHIERTGRYEPIVVRPYPPQKNSKNSADTANSAVKSSFQIINGHHRVDALKQLGYKTCDCIVWDVDDEETLLLLATLNQLTGKDILEKKTALLHKLNTKLEADRLSKLLPQSRQQIQRLIDLQKDKFKVPPIAECPEQDSFAEPLVFFLDKQQKQTVEKALSLAEVEKDTKAKRNARAITQIAEKFIELQHHNNQPSLRRVSD